MKTLLLIFMCISLLLVGCDTEPADTSTNPSAQESTDFSVSVSETVSDESEERKQWVETEIHGDDKITREYRDGKNDYTVTIENFYDDGTVSYRSILNYKNEIQVSSESYSYREDGTVSSSSKTTFSETGELDRLVSYNEYEDYAVTYDSKMDQDGSMCNGSVEYHTIDGELLAKGIVKREDFNGYDCHVESISVYTTEGAIDHTEIEAMGVGNTYYAYRELTDSDGKTYYSYESIDGDYTCSLSGEYDVKIMFSDEVSVYTDANGELIAELDGLSITKIGENYSVDNIIETIESIRAYRSQFEDELLL